MKKFDTHGAANSYELANSYGFLPISIVRISWTPLYESDYQQKYQQYYANQPIQGKLLDHTFNSSVRSELT